MRRVLDPAIIVAGFALAVALVVSVVLQVVHAMGEWAVLIPVVAAAAFVRWKHVREPWRE